MKVCVLQGITAGLILLLAALVRGRLPSMDPHIDEIWSLHLASLMQSPLDVFSLHSDNNHYLNTLWMFVTGQAQPFWVYRLPSFFAGVGLVALVMRFGWKERPAAGLILGVIMAVSALFSMQDAQARGYAPMLFFGFLAFLQLSKLMKTLNARDALLFALLSMIAFLWQLVFLHLFVAMLVLFLMQTWPLSTDRKKTALLLAFGPVMLLLYLLTVADWSYVVIGGGPAWTVQDMLLGAAGSLFGMTKEHAWTLCIAAGVLIATVAGTHISMRQNSAKGVFFLTLFLISPVLWLLFFHPTIIYPRYFIAPIFFIVLMLGSQLAAGLMQRNIFLRCACFLILCGYMIGNVHALYGTTQAQRRYSIPLEFLVTRSSSPVTIGSHVDFRTKLLLWYYAPRLQTEKQIVYLDQYERTHETPDFWLIDVDVENAPDTVVDAGTTYVPMENAPEHAGWALYVGTP